MKILVVSQYFYPELFRVNTLCRELVTRGHDVTVLTGYPQYPQCKIYDGYGFNIPYDKEWHGVKIERIKARPRGKTPFGLLLNCWSFVKEGKKWVKRCGEKFDVMYVFGNSPVTVALPAVAYKEKFGTPLLFNVQDLWPEAVEATLGVHNRLIISKINKIVNKIYMASDRVLCSSRGYAENIARRGIDRKKLVFWPQFCLQPDLDGMTKPEIYSDDTFNIVFTGNIGGSQGLDTLIDAAVRLKSEKIKWYLVGDGRAKESLQKAVTRNGLDDKVIFVGKVSESEANRYVHFADCAYLSFKKEALFDITIPAKLQTYLACGTPILAAADGESAEIIREAGCGTAVPPAEPDKLAEAAREMAGLSAEQLSDMGDKARRHYREYYTVDLLLEQLEKIMKEVCHENTAN